MSCRVLLNLVILFFYIGCDNFPKDPRNSLSDSKSKGLRVSFDEDAKIGGVIEKLSEHLNTHIIRVDGTQEEHFEKLQEFEIHLIVGRFNKDSPWKKHVGFTRVYRDSEGDEFLFAIPPGENAFLVELEKFLSNNYERAQ